MRIPLTTKTRVAVEPVRIRAQHRIADRLKATLQLSDAVIGIVIAERHRIDDAVEPRPLRAAIFVRPRRRTFVHHVAAGKDQRAVLLLRAQISDRPRDPALPFPPLGVERQRVRVIVGEMQQRDVRRPRVRRRADEKQRQKQRAPRRAPFVTNDWRLDHRLTADFIALMAASRPDSLAIF